LFSRAFFESLLELNQLDLYRNQENDKYFDTFIVDFDEISYEDMIKLFKSLFLPSVILKLFENAQNLINYIETNKLQKDKILHLKKDSSQYLTPIINKLEQRLFLAQAEGNKAECQKLEFSVKMHQQFLNDPLATMHLFQKAEIFLYRNRKYRYKLERSNILTKKQKQNKQIIDIHEQIYSIGKFYEGYEFFSRTYQKKLWHSTAIKIYKLCKFLNPKLIDNVLKEKVEYLFSQADMKITLNTTRLNDADLFIILNNIPIWAYKSYLKKRRLSIDIQTEKALLQIDKEKENLNEESNPYSKMFENTPISLFLLS